MASIAKLAIEIEARSGPLQKGLTRASGMISGFAIKARQTLASVGGAAGKVLGPLGSIAGKAMRLTGIFVGIGSAIAGAFSLAAFKQTAGAIDQVAKAADRVGMSTEGFLALSHAAQLAGADQQVLQRGLEALSRRLGEAATRGGTYAQTLQMLGLESRELISIPLDQAYARIADRIAQLPSPALQAKAAMDLFGRSGLQLVNLLRGGSAAMAQARKETEALGASFNRVDAAKVEAANDAITRLGLAFRGLKQRAVIAIAPMVATLSEKVSGWVAYVGRILPRVVAIAGGVARKFVNVFAVAYRAMRPVFQAIAAALRRIIPIVLALISAYIRWAKTSGLITVVARVWRFIGQAFEVLAKTVVVAIATIRAVIANWRTAAELAFYAVAHAAVKSWNVIVWGLTKVIPYALGYFLRNWRAIFQNLWAYTKGVFTNLFTNLVNLVKNIPGIIRGSVKWSDVWKPLTEGIRTIAIERFEIPARAKSRLEQELEATRNRLAGKLGESIGAEVTKSLAAFQSGIKKASENIELKFPTPQVPQMPKIEHTAELNFEPKVPTNKIRDAAQRTLQALIAGTDAAYRYMATAWLRRLHEAASTGRRLVGQTATAIQRIAGRPVRPEIRWRRIEPVPEQTVQGRVELNVNPAAKRLRTELGAVIKEIRRISMAALEAAARKVADTARRMQREVSAATEKLASNFREFAHRLAADAEDSIRSIEALAAAIRKLQKVLQELQADLKVIIPQITIPDKIEVQPAGGGGTFKIELEGLDAVNQTIKEYGRQLVDEQKSTNAKLDALIDKPTPAPVELTIATL